MDRRELGIALGGSVAGLLGLTAEARGDTVRHPGTNGFIVFTQEIGNMPSWMAEAFLDRIKDNIAKKKPDGWHIVVRTTREYGMGKVEVFVVNDRADIRAVERFIFDNKTNKLSDVDLTEQYNEENLKKIRDYVQVMLGAPVVRITNDIVPMIDHFIERGQKYRVDNLQQFVYESVRDTVHLVELDNGETYINCNLDGVDFNGEE